VQHHVQHRQFERAVVYVLSILLKARNRLTYRITFGDVTLKREVSVVHWLGIAAMVDVIAHRGDVVRDQVGSSGSQ
jgi:hypothetical protein